MGNSFRHLPRAKEVGTFDCQMHRLAAIVILKVLELMSKENKQSQLGTLTCFLLAIPTPTVPNTSKASQWNKPPVHPVLHSLWSCQVGLFSSQSLEKLLKMRDVAEQGTHRASISFVFRLVQKPRLLSENVEIRGGNMLEDWILIDVPSAISRTLRPL